MGRICILLLIIKLNIGWLEIHKGRDHLENLGIDGRIILKWILGKHFESVDWIHLAQDRDHLVGSCDMVMKLGVP
jgi:hypothetical protein